MTHGSLHHYFQHFQQCLEVISLVCYFLFSLNAAGFMKWSYDITTCVYEMYLNDRSKREFFKKFSKTGLTFIYLLGITFLVVTEVRFNKNVFCSLVAPTSKNVVFVPVNNSWSQFYLRNTSLFDKETVAGYAAVEFKKSAHMSWKIKTYVTIFKISNRCKI